MGDEHRVEVGVDDAPSTPMTREELLKRASLVGVALATPALAGRASAGGFGARAVGRTLEGTLTVTYMTSGTYDAAARELVPAFTKGHDVSVKVAGFPWVTL